MQFFACSNKPPIAPIEPALPEVPLHLHAMFNKDLRVALKDKIITLMFLECFNSMCVAHLRDPVL